MHPRDRRRRGGGTALLAAFAITGLTVALAGCGARDSASERPAERAVTLPTAQGVDSELRPLSVACVAYISEIPRLPDPPPMIMIERQLKEVLGPPRPLGQSPTVTDPVKDW